MNDVNKIIPIRDQIAGQIRSDIISGDMAPSLKLNEQALAERFGVSRGPVRDVLLQLTKEGLLVAKNNCGVSVNSALKPELQELMIDIRTQIEIFALKALKGKLTDADFTVIDNILQRIQDAFNEENYTEVTLADIDFHRFLIFKAGGEELVNLWYPIVLRMRMNYKRIAKPVDCVNEHKAISDALRKGNTREAIAALKANIR